MLQISKKLIQRLNNLALISRPFICHGMTQYSTQTNITDHIPHVITKIREYNVTKEIVCSIFFALTTYKTYTSGS
jgi:hypothetical protein